MPFCCVPLQATFTATSSLPLVKVHVGVVLLVVFQLLLKADISCCCVYSSLDQAARKINVAKFTHKKCSVMLVTDLAARGIDIPILDNVINFHFPAKGKLFVHRVGKLLTGDSITFFW